MTMSQPRYTVIIQWSDDDQCYVVSLPEWGCKTHGSTYEEAATNAREVLELLMEDETSVSPFPPHPHPPPKLFHYPGADVVNLPDSQDTNQVTQGPKRQTA
jgi:predicted RNase H-like HicB family nuclease